MTTDILETMLRQTLHEIDSTPPNALAPKLLGATIQRWDTTLAIVEHELMIRQPGHPDVRCSGDCVHKREPNKSMLDLAINLQTQLSLAYEVLPPAERARILATFQSRYANAVKTHTMRERLTDGPAQASLTGFGTLPKAS